MYSHKWLLADGGWQWKREMNSKDNKIGDPSMELLNHIAEEIRHIRKRLDDHIDEEVRSITNMEREMSKIREEMGNHRGKIAGITGFISLVVAGIVSWFVAHVGS